MDYVSQLPPEVKNLLIVALTVFSTQLVKWLSSQLKYDLSGYSAKITVGVISLAFAALNSGLEKVPAEFMPVIGQAFFLCLAAVGAYKLFVAKKSK